MTASDEIKTENTSTEDPGPELEVIKEASKRLKKELGFLFGEEVVEQASQVDIVDLNLNKAMTDCISEGLKQLKSLKSSPDAQQKLIREMTPGARIILCMWIMEMDLLDKIQHKK